LQGEQAVVQMNDKKLFRYRFQAGTVSGFSPRIASRPYCKHHVKTAVATVRSSSIIPLSGDQSLEYRMAHQCLYQAVESAGEISGIFNIASGNYTVGEFADFVKEAVEKKMGKKVKLNIKNIQDFRNYKVTSEKAMNMLSFKPTHNVESILDDL
jgi:nucleoside-diphosphate-sugar epimerase